MANAKKKALRGAIYANATKIAMVIGLKLLILYEEKKFFSSCSATIPYPLPRSAEAPRRRCAEFAVGDKVL
jgi:hypothetical protein